ncbi:hypothetical protein MTO96_034600 [Rhipicephalus appendiculatus]
MATARILYGLPLASISSNNWDKLEVVHRTAIRQYYSLPRTSQGALKRTQAAAKNNAADIALLHMADHQNIVNLGP